MRVNRENFEVVQAASNDGTRYALCSVYFDGYGTVATNGAMLATVSYPDQGSDDDLPKGLPVGKIADLKPFAVGVDAVKALTRAIPKTTSLPILKYLYVDVDRTNADGSATFAATDLETQSNPTVAKVEGLFPPYEQVIPKEKDLCEKVGYNPAVVAKAFAIVSKVMGSKQAGCVVRMGREPSQPMIIEGRNADTGQTVRVVVMPMRL